MIELFLIIILILATGIAVVIDSLIVLALFNIFSKRNV